MDPLALPPALNGGGIPPNVLFSSGGSDGGCMEYAVGSIGTAGVRIQFLNFAALAVCLAHLGRCHD